MKVRIIYLSVIIVGVVLSFSLARNLYTTFQNTNGLTETQRKLDNLQKENSKLQQQVADANQPDFIIRQAREKLGLVKPGEVVVVLPHQAESSPTASVAAQLTRPVWKQWLSLFFGG